MNELHQLYMLLNVLSLMHQWVLQFHSLFKNTISFNIIIIKQCILTVHFELISTYPSASLQTVAPTVQHINISVVCHSKLIQWSQCQYITVSVFTKCWHSSVWVLFLINLKQIPSTNTLLSYWNQNINIDSKNQKMKWIRF